MYTSSIIHNDTKGKLYGFYLGCKKEKQNNECWLKDYVETLDSEQEE